MHQAKGLEFDTVFVIGLAEGRFPVHARREALALPTALTGRPPDDSPDAQRAEERRLMYVALTRARDELILSHAVLSARGGRRRRPSGFLAEALGRPVDEPDVPAGQAGLEAPAAPATIVGPIRSGPTAVRTALAQLHPGR